MPKNKAVSLGDLLSGGKKFRLICTFSPIGELYFQWVDLESGHVVDQGFSIDAIAGFELYLHLKAFHSGEYAEEMEEEDQEIP